MSNKIVLAQIAAVLFVASTFAPSAVSQDAQDASDSFTPLFNGKTLDGWVLVNGATDTWTVKNEAIVCNGSPRGVLRTEKQYENFILEYEWRIDRENGNSGLFVHSDALPACGVPYPRSIEIQMADGNAGDIFPIHGASMVPYKPHPKDWMRSIPTDDRINPAGEWNSYRIESHNGSIILNVNGKTTNYAHYCSPRKGYICLESELKGEVHFRNLRIQELPTSNPRPNEIAKEDRGFRALFGDPSLSQWKPIQGSGWHTENWVVYYDGEKKGKANPFMLETQKEFTDFSLILDWRFPSKPILSESPVLWQNGTRARDSKGNAMGISFLNAGECFVYLRGHEKSLVNLWSWPLGSGGLLNYFLDENLSTDSRKTFLPLAFADRPIGQWNRLELTLIGGKITTCVNGQEIISNASIPDIPKQGPISIRHNDRIVLFTNIFIKELSQ